MQDMAPQPALQSALPRNELYFKHAVHHAIPAKIMHDLHLHASFAHVPQRRW